MHACEHSYLRILLMLLACFCCNTAHATHIVGGDISYKFLGIMHDSNQYQVNLTIYEDCLNGTAFAIAQDNPAYVELFEDTAKRLLDSAYFDTSITVPANFNNECVTNVPALCLFKKTFHFYFLLAANSQGYTIAYQRCCRNAAVQNLVNPSNSGTTFFCTIPPAPLANNSSAVFTNFPPQIICVNTPLVYNNSATDPNGDSLSYELCSSYWAPDGLDNDFITNPPFQRSQYKSPFSYSLPLTAYPALQIDAATGIITGTPNRVGRYLVTVCCHEWRNGAMINTIQREFQFVVTDCSKAVQADIPVLTSLPNTFKLNCTDYTISFINISKGGITWLWNFGVPGEEADTSTEYEPVFTYPDTGTFSVKLVVNPGSACADSIIRQVRVYPKFRAAFTDSGKQCAGAPLQFLDRSISIIKPVLYWKWYFGDGDSSTVQNPVHYYPGSGDYNVLFTSENINNCTDTVVKTVVIERVRPSAGHDTAIVKGEHVLFNASGGTAYTWRPATWLSDSNTYNPTGYYPDTGRFTYYVQVTSAYGCSGQDSIQVTVVNHAAFYVPSAFTPNGDGKNDVFRPLAIGYSTLNYFRIYNRWGQELYFGQSLDNGWDGTYHNKQAELGTYYWEIGFTDRFGRQGVTKGDITLLR